jgi:ubiquinone/menaquinone biosynthesis C-methylase UbiE
MHPDVVGSADALPFPDQSFDVVLAAEIYEHLPWESFSKCLAEARRVARKRVVVSLPHWGWSVILVIKLPLLRLFERLWKIDGLKKHPAGGEHYWEIGKKGWPLAKVRTEIERSGFQIERTFIRPMSPFHRFFILSPL